MAQDEAEVCNTDCGVGMMQSIKSRSNPWEMSGGRDG